MIRCLFVVLVTLTMAASFSPSAISEITETQAPSTVGLGHIEFPTSGSLEAQPWFLRGVLLLHNFQYDDAKEAFRHAQELNKSYVMAYWGEAMTANHPLWNEQNLEEGRTALHRISTSSETRLAKAPTKREQGYLQAVEALYGDGDKRTRDQAYLKAMRQLTERFPEDLEAAAFYALAILGSVQGERDTATYMRAAAIAENVFRKNPKHPGAVHYLIHAYDDPIHAPLGLYAAEIYSSLAPAASHAQHMPSHIFMALGMWEKVITANEAAWASSEARRKRKGLNRSARPYHTLRWLMYAYLQVARVKDAKRVLNLIEEDAEQLRSRYVRGYRASMRARYIIETQEWEAIHLKDDRSGLRFSFAASELFAIGMSAVKTHDLTIARQAFAELSKRIDPQQATSLSQEGLAGLCMLKGLEALILFEDDQQQKALTVLLEAVALEDSLPYDYGPPIPIKPAHELLGEIYSELGQRKNARKEFDLALRRAPNRSLALKGLQKLDDT